MIKRFVKSKRNYNEKSILILGLTLIVSSQIPSAMAKMNQNYGLLLIKRKDIPALQVNVEWLGNYFSGKA